jgi:hypothetical protein
LREAHNGKEARMNDVTRSDEHRWDQVVSPVSRRFRAGKEDPVASQTAAGLKNALKGSSTAAVRMITRGGMRHH